MQNGQFVSSLSVLLVASACGLDRPLQPYESGPVHLRRSKTATEHHTAFVVDGLHSRRKHVSIRSLELFYSVVDDSKIVISQSDVVMYLEIRFDFLHIGLQLFKERLEAVFNVGEIGYV